MQVKADWIWRSDVNQHTGRVDPPAGLSGTFSLGGELEVRRLGFGAMRITGEGIWRLPKDPDAAIRVLRRNLELGVNFIDTADSYGPNVSGIDRQGLGAVPCRPCDRDQRRQEAAWSRYMDLRR